MFSPDVLGEYPIFQTATATYLDTAGRSVLPDSVEKNSIAALKQKSCPWNGITDPVKDVRELFSRLINSPSAENIAISPSTAFAMTMAADNIAKKGVLAPGMNVVVIENEMASVVYPWQNACELTGSHMKVAKRPAVGESTWVESVLSAIDDDTVVLALPCVHWCDGSIIDIKSIMHSVTTHRCNHSPSLPPPLLIIDGTQSIGALPFDVQELKPAFVACSVHKWINSVYGMSLMYLSDEYGDWMPLDQHERSRIGESNPEWDEEMSQVDPATGKWPTDFKPGATRLDTGGRCNPITATAVKSGLKLVLDWQPANIQAYLRNLTDSMVRKLRTNLGRAVVIHSADQRSGHIVGIRLRQDLGRPSIHCEAQTTPPLVISTICRALKSYDIHTSVRAGCLRVSPYVHTSMCQINKFVGIFTQLVCMHSDVRIDWPISTTINANVEESKVLIQDTAPLRVLLTGACGWVGQFMCERLLTRMCAESDRPSLPVCNLLPFSQGLDVFAAYRTTSGKVPDWVVNERRVALDLTDPSSITIAVEYVKPDVLIHLAAESSPAVCHRDKDHVLAVNCPTALVKAVSDIVPNCLFVYTSTDMVYDGIFPPYYATTEEPSPVNTYGESKLKFESEVRTLGRGFCLRLSNVVGPPTVYAPAGTKFLQFLTDSFRGRKYIGLKKEEKRSFVYVQDVVDVVMALIHKHAARTSLHSNLRLDPHLSTLNVGGPRGLSRLDLAYLLCHHTGANLRVFKSEDERIVDDYVPISATSTTKETARKGHVEPWEVFVMVDTPVASTELKSPVDITMNSTQTEKMLEGVMFRDISSMIGKCLAVE